MSKQDLVFQQTLFNCAFKAIDTPMHKYRIIHIFFIRQYLSWLNGFMELTMNLQSFPYVKFSSRL